MCKQYVDDTHVQFKSKEHSGEFPKNIKTKINNGRYEYDVYHKPGLTNVQINPHSCKPSSIITTIFKGLLARATKIFSEKYLRAEIEYLTDTKHIAKDNL